MRLAIWAYTAAVGFASLAVTMLGWMFGNIFHSQNFTSCYSAKPLPLITQFLLDFHGWALVLPLPWLITTLFLIRREAATPSRCLAFAGISTLTITFLFTFTAISFASPFVSIIVCMDH